MAMPDGLPTVIGARDPSPDRLVLAQAPDGLGWFAAIVDDGTTPGEPVFEPTLDETLRALAGRIDRWLAARAVFGAESASTRRWRGRSATHGSVLDYLRSIVSPPP